MKLTMFYDPQSRRMKTAGFLYPDAGVSCYLYHHNRVYRDCKESDNPFFFYDIVLSRDKKLIGFGCSNVDVRKKAPCLRPLFNAVNAVVNGQPNAVNPTRDTFAEVTNGDYSDCDIYWYFTKSWEKFREQVNDNKEKVLDGENGFFYPVCYIGFPPNYCCFWEGYLANNQPTGDCILGFESWNYPLGFELETENVPQWIDSSTQRPVSS